ncbi:MAG: hypothetical protein RLZZ519_1564 [Bacteroidota bacterium]|jgi:hypothetical protein
MDMFEGNKKLEAVIFDGLDYALYSRHDIRGPFSPFMMLYQGEKKQLMRLMGSGDPMVGLEDMLRKSGETYDYIVMCCEGRIPHGDSKHDAVMVKGFDTSRPQGFLFGQRFQGIESGGKFKKLGNPALLSKTEPLPVPLVDRNDDEEFDEPFISGMVVKSPSGKLERVIFAGHESASVLSPLLYEAVAGALKKAEPDFSGQFTFNFVPDTLKDSGLTQFILAQLYVELLETPAIQQWESRNGRKLEILLEFNQGKGPVKMQRPSTGGTSGATGSDRNSKPWWKFW